MKFLQKTEDSEIIARALTYDRQSDRSEIRRLLKIEQKGFCAYSERYIQETDSPEIEHFDGRLKGSDEDGYSNWYLVLRWMNSHKAKKIEPYLPILSPYAEDLADRIRYDDGLFVAREEDAAAQNLINYLGFNRYELCTDRNKHIERVKMVLREFCDNDKELLKAYLLEDPIQLSFITALEIELG